MGTYTKSSINRAARPRSERLREIGGAIVSTSASLIGGNSYVPSGPTHSHANLDSLNKITVEDGYIYLTDTYVDETTGDEVTETVKASVGFADRAAANASGHTLDWFIPVTANGVLTLKLNPIYAGLWAAGFMTGGGINSGSGGGGGGVDLDRVWVSLTNNTDKPDVKINQAHIPDLPISRITGLEEALEEAGGGLSEIPLATDSAIGGFKTGYTESGKNYAVRLSEGKAYVNVPWTSSTYSHPTNGANTTITEADTKVLSSITVDSLGHVTAVSSKTIGKADIPALDYLPLTGGELTGNLWLHTNSSNYGSKLFFGDKGSNGYVYLHEDSDDHLSVYADKGLKLATGGSYGILLDNNTTLNSARSFTLGEGVLTWDANESAWKLAGNLYATGSITAGGTNPRNGAIRVENDVVIDSSKTVTFGSGAVLSYNNGWKLTAGLNVTALTISNGVTTLNVATAIYNLQQSLQNHEQRIAALENR